MSLPKQLALPFPHQPDYAAEAFLEAHSNADARAWLNRSAEWPGGRLVLWGEAGSGKTHLLHRWALDEGAMVLDGRSMQHLIPVPEQPLAIDNADEAPETPLLHVLNAAAEAKQRLLLAARVPPARWAVRLPDLASRLRATTAVGILRPDDLLLRSLLARLLAERRLCVSQPVQDWLLVRLPRSPAAIREAVERLDRLAWQSGRAVGRGMAAAVLAEVEQGCSSAD
ncbi:MAG: chromosomal replication initiator DnaA [Acetobacteraceae bacterium]|nr:chromosomal replication initiator DnaA [Acetobacteraceae bacterium]